jgi:hypothetical protein
MEALGFNEKLSPENQCAAQDAIAAVLYNLVHENGGFTSFEEDNPGSTERDYVNFATTEVLTVALVHFKRYNARTVREAAGEFWGPLFYRVKQVLNVDPAWNKPAGEIEEACVVASRDILLMVAQEYASELLV